MYIYNIKKRCELCGKLLDANGKCPNAFCLMSQPTEPMTPEEKEAMQAAQAGATT